MPGPLLLQKNPPLQRFKYVAKTYGEKYPDVVLDTFFSLADTVGIENPAREFDAMRRWAYMRNNLLSDEVSRRSGGRTGPVRELSTPSSINRQQQEMLQQLLVELKDDPRMGRGRESDALWPWLGRELVRLKKQGHVMEGGSPAWMEWSSRVKGKGSAIALWQRQTRADLGQWRLDAVLEAREDFELEQRGDIPQGMIIYEFDDGWTVQELSTGEELEAEGEVMQHCVGSYCPLGSTLAEQGNIIVYSLRDPKGRPHATMETREGWDRFTQVQGKQNRAPEQQYLERVVEFARTKGINPSQDLTSEEYNRACRYGSERGEEAWEENSRRVNFAISLASESYDGEGIDVWDILDNTNIKGAPEDWSESDLGASLEEAALEGANEAWDEALSQVQDSLSDLIDDVVTAAQEEVDEGADPDSVDLDYAIEMALASSDLPWGRADHSYAVEEAESRAGK